MFGMCAGGFQLTACPLCCAPFFSPSQLLWHLFLFYRFYSRAALLSSPSDPFPRLSRFVIFLHEGQAEGYACWEEREEERLISELVCTSEAAALRMLASLASADKTTAAIVSPKLNIPGKSETVPVLMAREPLSLHTPCFLSECL